MAINLGELEISPEVAQARANFAATHGESKKVGGAVHYYSRSYKGTPEDISQLQRLSEDPTFRAEHQGQGVFAVGRKIVGILPEPFPNGDQTAEKLTTRKFYQNLQEAGVEPFNCAIITVEAPLDKPLIIY